MNTFEELITFETSALAKENGFDWNTHDAFVNTELTEDVNTEDNSTGFNYFNSQNHNERSNRTSRPSQSLLARWLREVHEIVVFVSFETIDDSETAYVWNIVTSIHEGKGSKKNTWDFYERRDSFSKQMMWYSTYETALEAALQTALKLIV